MLGWVQLVTTRASWRFSKGLAAAVKARPKVKKKAESILTKMERKVGAQRTLGVIETYDGRLYSDGGPANFVFHLNGLGRACRRAS